MPKVKPVDSLFSLCIVRINYILTTLIFPVNVERSIENTTESDNESKINPFHKIPTALLEDVIHSLPNSKQMKNFNIKFLITTKLQKLIFPRFYCYKFEQYLNFFPKLEKLQVLVLRNSNVDNMCLKLIGTWCKNLRILNVNQCSRLSDTGVEWLVLQSPEMSKTLQELLITCPGVTKKGIKMAVQHFSALQVLESIHFFKVLVDVVQSVALAQHPPDIFSRPMSFTRLVVCHPIGLYTAGNFGSVVSNCPLLFDLIILVKMGLTDTDLSCLINLKNLQILKFYADPKSNEYELTFDKGLAPVLQMIGSSLQVLDLSYFEYVDIWTIVKYCPNLMYLLFENQDQSLSALSENEIIELRNEKGRVIFKELKVLECGENLSYDILFDLLSCPLLESLYIAHCDAFTDDLLKEAISNGNLENLKILSLESCHFVTKEGLDGLVLTDNNLERLYLEFCDQMTQANVNDWHRFARQKNWKLHLSYEDYGTKLTVYD